MLEYHLHYLNGSSSSFRNLEDCVKQMALDAEEGRWFKFMKGASYDLRDVHV